MACRIDESWQTSKSRKNLECLASIFCRCFSCFSPWKIFGGRNIQSGNFPKGKQEKHRYKTDRNIQRLFWRNTGPSTRKQTERSTRKQSAALGNRAQHSETDRGQSADGAQTERRRSADGAQTERSTERSTRNGFSARLKNNPRPIKLFLNVPKTRSECCAPCCAPSALRLRSVCAPSALCFRVLRSVSECWKADCGRFRVLKRISEC